jgi:hypothetical protein
VLALTFAGCVSPVQNYQPEATKISEPALGSTNAAQVGEEMLKQGKFWERDAIRLSESIKFGMFGAYTMSPGFYVKTGDDAESAFYLPAQGRDGGEIIKAALADPWKAVQLMKDGKRIAVVTVFNVAVREDAKGVSKTKWLALSDDSFQQTLIYSGRVGGKIKVGYREFSNNQARPAFNNDVEYDLTESMTIGYKGARLEVLEATNQLIRYKVLQNFNQAER